MHSKKTVCCALLTLTSVVLVTGCRSYSPAHRPTVTSQDLLQRAASSYQSEACTIQLVVLNDKRLAKSYVGIDPVKSSMVPVFIKLTNSGQEPVKVELAGSALQTQAGELCRALSIDEAIARARRSDAEVVGWTIGFGMVGAMVSGEHMATVNRSLEEDYHQKGFKPSLLNSQGSGEGLVFFDVPAAKLPLLEAAVLQLLNLSSNAATRVTVKL